MLRCSSLWVQTNTMAFTVHSKKKSTDKDGRTVKILWIKLDINHLNMELPVFPDELKEVLTCLDTNGKELCWTIQRSSKKTVLSLTWKILSKSPPNEVPHRKFVSSSKRSKPVGNPTDLRARASASASSAGATCQSGQKKKKSPSRLKRDRIRLQQFKEKKRRESGQQVAQRQTAQVSAKCRVINYRHSQRRSFIYHYPIPVCINKDTTASEVKHSIYNSLQQDGIFGDVSIPSPSCISLIQTAGDVGDHDQPGHGIPMWVVPDSLPFCQIYAANDSPKHIQFDVCLDPPADDTSDVSEDWETESTGSQSDGSFLD